MNDTSKTLSKIPARDVPIPSFLSPAAQAQLATPAFGLEGEYPALEDKAAWRTFIAKTDEFFASVMAQTIPSDQTRIDEREVDGVRVYDAAPLDLEAESRGLILDFHGGGLVYCGGDLCRLMAQSLALRLRKRVLSVDYGMPPDHPYPSGLDDCLAVYRALLKEYSADEVVVFGASAGGNLAAALVLRARDEGLPLPAGVILNTPEVDLTESGDSFQTNLGVDPVLGSLMPQNLLYANGHDLSDPYLSPLFGDFSKGFPPTILATGTRDLYLSNTVRMHRALRAADIEAELHVLEAAPHGNFPGSPEGDELDREFRRFIGSVLKR